MQRRLPTIAAAGALWALGVSTIAEPPPTLPPGASVDELTEAALAALGPTDDLVGEVAAFVPVPEDVPTPAGAEIVNASLYLSGSGDAIVRAYLTFKAPASADDLVTLYQTGLRAAGYRQVTDNFSEQFGRHERQMRFEYAESPEPTDTFSLGSDRTVTITILDDDDDPQHELRFSEPVTDAHLEVFGGWHDGMPVPKGGTITSADVSVFRRLTPPHAVRINTMYRFDDLDASRLEDVFESALPTGGYAIEPSWENRPEQTVMAKEGLDRPTAYFSDAITSGAFVSISAGVDLETAADP